MNKVASGDLKLKGSVREIGIIRDGDRYDSFNIVIGISIRRDGKVAYEEAERLASKFKKEYLGKDVEFLAVSIPCSYCEKVLNSEGGLKMHIRQVHPEKVDQISFSNNKAKQVKQKSSKSQVNNKIRTTTEKKVKKQGSEVKEVKKFDNQKKDKKAVKEKKARKIKGVIDRSPASKSTIKISKMSAKKNLRRGKQLTLS